MNVFTFPENPPICPVLSLKEYLARTALLWHADALGLFVGLTKLYKYVTSQTLAFGQVDQTAHGRC